MQLAATITAHDIVSRVEARLLATELTNEDTALLVKLDRAAKKAGGLLHVPPSALTFEEWARVETLNDLGLL